MSKHLVTIGRVEFVLDQCDRQWSWFSLPNGIAPACPECMETLTPCCDDDSTDAQVLSYCPGEFHLRCDNCAETWPIDGAEPLPSKDAGRMPCPNSEDGYHPFRSHICTLCGCEQPEIQEMQEREHGDDDGVEYADPREARS